jgi:hypothetical protein
VTGNRVDRGDGSHLPSGLVVATTEKARRFEIELEKITSGTQIHRIEANRLLELAPYSNSQRKALFAIRLFAVRSTKPAMHLGVVGGQGNAALERLNRCRVIMKLELCTTEPEKDWCARRLHRR